MASPRVSHPRARPWVKCPGSGSIRHDERVGAGFGHGVGHAERRAAACRADGDATCGVVTRLDQGPGWTLDVVRRRVAGEGGAGAGGRAKEARATSQLATSRAAMRRLPRRRTGSHDARRGGVRLHRGGRRGGPGRSGQRAGQRQTSGQPQPGAAVRGEDAGGLRVPGAGDGERTVPDPWRDQHRAAHGGGVRQSGGRAHDERGLFGGQLGKQPVPPHDGGAPSAAGCRKATASVSAARPGGAAGDGAGGTERAGALPADPGSGNHDKDPGKRGTGCAGPVRGKCAGGAAGPGGGAGGSAGGPGGVGAVAGGDRRGEAGPAGGAGGASGGSNSKTTTKTVWSGCRVLVLGAARWGARRRWGVRGRRRVWRWRGRCVGRGMAGRFRLGGARRGADTGLAKSRNDPRVKRPRACPMRRGLVAGWEEEKAVWAFRPLPWRLRASTGVWRKACRRLAEARTATRTLWIGRRCGGLGMG